MGHARATFPVFSNLSRSKPPFSRLLSRGSLVKSVFRYLDANRHRTLSPNMPNILTGVVTKTGAMSKTITVTIGRKYEHPKLLKNLYKTHKMLVHDENEKGRVGDHVTILHGRPISKRKHFTLQSVDFRPEVESIPSARDIERVSRRASGIMEAIREQQAIKQATETTQ